MDFDSKLPDAMLLPFKMLPNNPPSPNQYNASKYTLPTQDIIWSYQVRTHGENLIGIVKTIPSVE